MALNVRRTGHLERVPGDTRKRVYVQFGPFCRTIKVMQFPNVRAKQALTSAKGSGGSNSPVSR